MVVIVRWLLHTGKYICVSGSMVNRWLLLLGVCCMQVNIVGVW